MTEAQSEGSGVPEALVDENPASRLASDLADLFPDSMHVLPTRAACRADGRPEIPMRKAPPTGEPAADCSEWCASEIRTLKLPVRSSPGVS
jgi:hypothetical protein